MPVYIGEIHADVATSAPLDRPAARETVEAQAAAGDRLLDGISRMSWLAERVGAEGFDD
jgi:hypothetical protein